MNDYIFTKIIGKLAIMSVLLSGAFCPVHAQVRNSFSWGIETGGNFYSTLLQDPTVIRRDVDRYNYDDGSTSGNVNTSASSFYMGLKGEALFFNMIGLSSGIRFSRLYTKIDTDWSWSSEDFFYYLFRQSETNTEYLKIRKLSQTSAYLGVPLEFRFFPYRASFVRLYFKMGGDVNFRLSSVNRANFVSSSMQKNETDLFDDMETKPSSVYSNIYGGIGLRFGKEIRPKVNVEMMYVQPLSDKVSSLVRMNEGLNLQVTVQIPFR